jgi:hypothetical protein
MMSMGIFGLVLLGTRAGAWAECVLGFRVLRLADIVVVIVP